MPASQMQAGSKVDRPTPDMVVSMGLDAQLQAFRPMKANQRTSIDYSPGAFMQLCRRNHWTAPAIAAHVGGYRSNWAATTHKRPPTWCCVTPSLAFGASLGHTSGKSGAWGVPLSLCDRHALFWRRTSPGTVLRLRVPPSPSSRIANSTKVRPCVPFTSLSTLCSRPAIRSMHLSSSNPKYRRRSA